MKRFLVLLCMITCIFGLTACGSEETLTEYEQWKVDNAKQLAGELLVPLLSNDDIAASLEGYTAEEVEYIVSNEFSLYADGNALISALGSFRSGKDAIGGIASVGSSTATIDGSEIIVEVEVVGGEKKATAEIILSNDLFLRLESAALNPSASMGELMGKAALNTLIGMGTVFAVLILISGIISAFRIIPKLQESRKKKEAPAADTGIDNAVAQIEEQEEAVDETDDLELVAVIAAAVAAYEGSATTEGFVVRSIRRCK